MGGMLTSDSRSIVEVLEQDIMPRLTVDDVYGDVSFRTRNGRYWRAPCPLHGGDDPNFSVDTETLSWTCWSRCGHGSAVSFLNGGEPARGARFVELVHELARQVDVDVAVDAMSPAERRRLDERLRRQDLLEAYVTLAHRCLSEPGGDRVRRYLVERGLPDDVAALVRLGLGAHPTPRGLADLRVNPRELREAGLADPRWQGRLVITWRDRAKRVATLAARQVQPATDDPKYLYLANARRPAYFGVDALTSRSDPSPLVVVEGLLDALVLRAHGFGRVLALGSSAPSPKHIEELTVLGVRRVVLMLDADGAGITGTRAFLELAKQDAELQVTVVPWTAYRGCKDPAALVSAHGSDAASDAIAARLPGAVFLAGQSLSGICPTSTLAERREALSAVSDVVRQMTDGRDSVDVEDVVALAVTRTGYPEAAVRATLGVEEGRASPSSDGVRSTATLALIEDMCGGHIPPEAELPPDDVIWRVVDTLDQRLATVLSLHYGRHGPPQTLNEIAPMVTNIGREPITRERVRQLNQKGLRQLHYPTRLAVLVGQEAMVVLHPPKRAKSSAGTPDDRAMDDATGPAPSQPPILKVPEQLPAMLRDILGPLGGSAPLAQLTHVLRGSEGPATRALIAEHALPHVGSLAHLDFRAAKYAIETMASSDASLRVVVRGDGTAPEPRTWLELKAVDNGEVADQAAAARDERLTATEAGMLAALKAWRLERSRSDGVPAFVVAHDRTLVEIARTMPTSPTSLARVYGMGPARLEKYADEVLAVLSRTDGARSGATAPASRHEPAVMAEARVRYERPLGQQGPLSEAVRDAYRALSEAEAAESARQHDKLGSRWTYARIEHGAETGAEAQARLADLKTAERAEHRARLHGQPCRCHDCTKVHDPRNDDVVGGRGGSMSIEGVSGGLPGMGKR